jgi:hypothetical protein
MYVSTPYAVSHLFNFYQHKDKDKVHPKTGHEGPEGE